MSMYDPLNPLGTPQPPTPQIGELVSLGKVVIKLDVAAQSTMPDTPNGYTAAMRVMADQGDLDSSALRGQQGSAGQISFQVREEINPYISNVSQLPILSDSPTDIGKYFLLEELNEQNVVVAQYAYIWYGTYYRKLMMGAYGPPGPVPNITPEVDLIQPLDANLNAVPSFVQTGGPRLDPVWLFNLAVPEGQIGPPLPLLYFPDFDEVTNGPVDGDLMTFTGLYTPDLAPQFVPRGIGGVLPTTYTMPEGAFSSFSGLTYSVPVGGLALPPQAFPWTPIVWGHIGMGGFQMSPSPFLIGCEVKLGDPASGPQIARGLGTNNAEVNIMPHYSSSTSAAGNNTAISQSNGYCVVPPNHTGNQGTVYVNLWNDGQLGLFFFNPTGAQLFITVLPVGPIAMPLQGSAHPRFSGSGFYEVNAERVV